MTDMTPNETFLKLFLRHQGDVKAFLASVVRDRAAVDDLFQDVSLTLWQSFPTYDPARSFGAWARGIAAKKVLQAWEKSRRLPLSFSPRAVQAVLDAYDRAEAEGPDSESLRDCIGALTERARQMLVLRYEKALKLGEIARQVGSTLDAVHKLLSRSREALQECLDRKLRAEGR